MLPGRQREQEKSSKLFQYDFHNSEDLDIAGYLYQKLKAKDLCVWEGATKQRQGDGIFGAYSTAEHSYLAWVQQRNRTEFSSK